MKYELEKENNMDSSINTLGIWEMTGTNKASINDIFIQSYMVNLPLDIDSHEKELNSCSVFTC